MIEFTSIGWRKWIIEQNISFDKISYLASPKIEKKFHLKRIQ